MLATFARATTFGVTDEQKLQRRKAPAKVLPVERRACGELGTAQVRELVRHLYTP
ncbi:hypothetical protein ACFPIJ_28755 [Dactylosporangium cerinum]|uniref:Uncharacterized protein n=1 Tax=Dactylosporangium cerinum TaxID=1434730 RepID=A0ABV9W498_9ACTN